MSRSGVSAAIEISATHGSFGRNSSVSRPSAPTRVKARDAPVRVRRRVRMVYDVGVLAGEESLVGEDDAPGRRLRRPRSPPGARCARSQSVETKYIAWLQKKIVRPEALSSKMRSTHFFWKRPSPTARASSRRITSGRTAVATENARRICMPDEYVFTGRSKKSPSSANSSISGSAAATSSRESPASAAWRITFRRPVSSGWKDVPSSRIDAIRPGTFTDPDVAAVVPRES